MPKKPPIRPLQAPESGASPSESPPQTFTHVSEADYAMVNSPSSTDAFTHVSKVLYAITSNSSGSTYAPAYASTALWYMQSEPEAKLLPGRHPARRARGDSHYSVWYGDDDFQRLEESSEEYIPREVAVTRQWNAHPNRAPVRERARGLLLRHLSVEQRANFNAHGYFDLLVPDVEGGPEPGRYRLRLGQFRNVYRLQLDNDEILATYCLHPEDRVPHEDALLAQKLMLTYDPLTFADRANYWPGFCPFPKGPA